jgi:hypothetical protein
VWTKLQIRIAIAVMVALILLAWYFYRSGKRSATGPVVDFPKGNAEIPAGWNPTALADELHDVMDGGATATGTKDDAWRKLADLPTDDMVKAVYSAFNQKYFGEGNGTLTQWIRDERWYDFFSGIKDRALGRLTKLSLA